ncbi:DinB family protein [Meridianimaribacter flavus]|uniref:DinB family protein n=1 Tax=Meridianimaribacter flavus TaxID=571115 RepID=A0ABY2G436_9FLAO|nr:DinB family protein [Meridianimaribacter flavus]TDY11265.1 DinB family protein [Meridianimaribacter flavus]
MDKESIAELLESKHQILIDVLSSQDDEKWQQGPEGKWTSGQQALHLLQSIKPLNDALSLPKFIIKYRFGKANRTVRDYTTVVNRYQERLQESKGIVYGPSKNMKVPLLKDKNYILNRLQVENKKLQYKTRKLSDKHLDTLILPHPLMGKMPLREIIMWTAYHVEHHTKQLQENY